MKQLIIFFIALLMFDILSAQVIEGSSNPIALNIGEEKDSTEAISLKSIGISKIPNYYALIIGVSEYQYAGPGLPSLDMPVKDSEKLSVILKEKYTFDSANITILKNPNREEIINQFERLALNITDKDNLLIFYAGHGVYDKSKDFGFWLPSDAKLTSRSAWIANSTIKDYVGAIKSKHTLLITDACFSGSIFKSRSVEAVVKRFIELYRDKSRKALTSGNLTEVPDDSVFIKFLLKGLEDNEDLFLSSSVLFNRIYEPILNNAPAIPQYGIIQGAGDEGGDFIFIKRDKF